MCKILNTLWIELQMLNDNIGNNSPEGKQISTKNTFKIVIYNQFVILDLVLNNPQGLIYHKTSINQATNQPRTGSIKNLTENI